MEPFNWFMNVVTQHYFDFEGRARRAEFWWYTLVYFIFAVVLGIIQNILGLGTILSSLLNLGLLLPSLSVGARRLHDIGRSGWWQLLGITVIGIVVLIYWWAQPGADGQNEYGANPKAAA
ncbi:MAG TPA: DUF805 domain-containing protein [Rhizomicrobium sp.]